MESQKLKMSFDPHTIEHLGIIGLLDIKTFINFVSV